LFTQFLTAAQRYAPLQLAPIATMGNSAVGGVGSDVDGDGDGGHGPSVVLVDGEPDLGRPRDIIDPFAEALKGCKSPSCDRAIVVRLWDTGQESLSVSLTCIFLGISAYCACTFHVIVFHVPVLVRLVGTSKAGVRVRR
jgi:hypothetical protein